ncbi:MAG: hypothetical protein GF381_03605 [Candidatus Pacebacteria bacterium]|nr:hypothetical protein [Candidatus Paceibacterota bacterium]
MAKKKKTDFQALGSLFDDYQVKRGQGYITREFQDFGYRLAVELDDLKHKSLYIKMAKEEERSVLEQALRYVADANARSKAKLFMWKVSELKKEKDGTDQSE